MSTKRLTWNDILGRPMVDLVAMRMVHFTGLFAEQPDEEHLTMLDAVLRRRLVYLLKHHGDDRAVLQEELDAWRRLVPHEWAKQRPLWAMRFIAYADLVAAAGVVAATRGNHEEDELLVEKRKGMMKREGFTLLGE